MAVRLDHTIIPHVTVRRQPDGKRRRPRFDDGGRGVYFPSPDDHLFEIITVPYGGVAKPG